MSSLTNLIPGAFVGYIFMYHFLETALSPFSNSVQIYDMVWKSRITCAKVIQRPYIEKTYLSYLGAICNFKLLFMSFEITGKLIVKYTTVQRSESFKTWSL